jgi:hypothetical protein
MSSAFVFDLDCMDPCSFSGVDDMLAARCLCGACALAACAVIRWQPRHLGDDGELGGRVCNLGVTRGAWGMRLAACSSAMQLTYVDRGVECEDARKGGDVRERADTRRAQSRGRSVGARHEAGRDSLLEGGGRAVMARAR